MVTRRASAVMVAFVILSGGLLIVPGRVSATQDAPSWGPGNYWVYRSISNNGTTMSWTVGGGETVAVGGSPYDTWHVWENSTYVTSSYSFTIFSDAWLTKDGLKQVKSVNNLPFFGKVTTTWDPPMPYAVFPLDPGSTWAGTSTQTVTSNFGTSSTVDAWSGLVQEEASVSVPAGDFPIAKLRTPATGAPYSIYYYSEQAGWAVQIESYNDNGVLTDTLQLTSYNYNPYFLGLPPTAWVIIAVSVFVAAAAVAVLLFRRRQTGQEMSPPQRGSPPEGLQ